MDRIEALRGSPLLNALEESQLKGLASITQDRSFAEGATIISSDQTKALAMYVILEGSADVVKDGVVISTLGPGDHVGEMALVVPNMKRTADVIAATTTTVMQLASWDFMPYLKTNPDVALAVIEELAKRLDEANRRLADS